MRLELLKNETIASFAALSYILAFYYDRKVSEYDKINTELLDYVQMTGSSTYLIHTLFSNISEN